MKTQQTDPKRAVRRLSAVLLFGAILAMMFPAGAWAVGTDADEDIDNLATITYQVGTANLTVESSPTGNSTVGPGGGTVTTFKVDRMVDLTVARVDATYATGPAGGTAVLTFTVANTGNDTFDFDLNGQDPAGLINPFAGAENLTGITVANIWVDSDGSGPTSGGSAYDPGAHSFDAGDTAGTPNRIDNLGQDQMINVYMVCNIPGTAPQDAIAVLLLRATARAADGSAMTQHSGANTDALENVFADDDADGGGAPDIDSARNAQDVDTNAFQVQAPNLTVSKTSAVQSDPIPGNPNPMAIPGAVVRYTISIQNNGNQPATGILVTDMIPNFTWLVAGSVTGGVQVSYSTDGGGSYSTTVPPINNGRHETVTHIQVDVADIAVSGSATGAFDVVIL